MQNHNWAVSAGQYLLKRRQQTHQAYFQFPHDDLTTQSLDLDNNDVGSEADSELDSEAVNRSNGEAVNRSNGEANNEARADAILFMQYADSIFQALLTILVYQLEQGHTVLCLSQQISTTQAAENKLNDWQLSLIDKLLIDWQDFDWQGMTDTNQPLSLMQIVEYLANKATIIDDQQFKQLLMQETQLIHATQLDNGHRQYLLNQLQLSVQLYQFFVALSQQLIDKKQGLSIFAQLLKSSALIVAEDELWQQHRHAPIVMNFSANDNSLTLWLHRSWYAEQSIIKHIHRLNQARPQPLDFTNVNQSMLKDEQVLAINTANHSAFSIITGGPGTGKTYTVAQLVIALYYANQRARKQGNRPLSLVLTAPTGKASQRMQESLQSALDKAGVSMNLQEAKTIHRLLGIGRTGIPKYSADNPLAEDIIIVDEASMLGVELANYLFSSVKTGARLIFLGDAHQLSAVEAGSVLADLCQMQSLQEVHAQLCQSSRFTEDSAVGQLATLINQSPEQSTELSALQALFTQYQQDLQLYEQIDNPLAVYQGLIKSYQAYFADSKALLTLAIDNREDSEQNNEQLFDLMQSFNQFRILTVGHHGNYGDERINEILSQHHRQYLQLPLSQLDWYHGRPVMVRKNNYTLGLFNGDIGICVETKQGLAVYFEGRDSAVPIHMLADLEVSTAYAMTVHKSQGSEFTHVAVMLGKAGKIEQDKIGLNNLANSALVDSQGTNVGFNVASDVGSDASREQSRLLSRELLYTAVTRAKQQVSIYGSLATMSQAICQPTVRHTGLSRVSID